MKRIDNFFELQVLQSNLALEAKASHEQNSPWLTGGGCAAEDGNYVRQLEADVSGPSIELKHACFSWSSSPAATTINNDSVEVIDVKYNPLSNEQDNHIEMKSQLDERDNEVQASEHHETACPD